MGHDNLSSEAALVTGARIVGRIDGSDMDYINYLDYQSGGVGVFAPLVLSIP